jgi:hypothetical protein
MIILAEVAEKRLKNPPLLSKIRHFYRFFIISPQASKKKGKSVELFVFPHLQKNPVKNNFYYHMNRK